MTSGRQLFRSKNGEFALDAELLGNLDWVGLGGILQASANDEHPFIELRMKDGRVEAGVFDYLEYQGQIVDGVLEISDVVVHFFQPEEMKNASISQISNAEIVKTDSNAGYSPELVQTACAEYLEVAALAKKARLLFESSGGRTQ